MVAVATTRGLVVEVDPGGVGPRQEVGAAALHLGLLGARLRPVGAGPQLQDLAARSGLLGGETDACGRPCVVDPGSAGAGADQPAVRVERGIVGAAVMEVVEHDPARVGRLRAGNGRAPCGRSSVAGGARRAGGAGAAGGLVPPDVRTSQVCGHRPRRLKGGVSGVERTVVHLVQLPAVGAVQLQSDGSALGAGCQTARTRREADLEVAVGGGGGIGRRDGLPGDVRAADSGLDAVERVRGSPVAGEVVANRHVRQAHPLVGGVDNFQPWLGHRSRGRAPGLVPDGELWGRLMRGPPLGIEREATGGHGAHQKQRLEHAPRTTSRPPVIRTDRADGRAGSAHRGSRWRWRGGSGTGAGGGRRRLPRAHLTERSGREAAALSVASP